MNHISNHDRVPPFGRRWSFGSAIAAVLAGAMPNVAAADPAFGQQEVRIALSEAELGDPRSRERVRRRIAAAAHRLCGSDGLAAVHRQEARRCRAQVVADAERQLAQRLPPRFAARAHR